MLLNQCDNQRICVLGYGVEGRSAVRALEKAAPNSQITIADQNEAIVVENDAHDQQIGADWLNNLADFDIIIKSPGIPPLPQIQAVQEKVTNTTQIFLDTVMATGSTVIGVTGSKGKSTVSSLIAAILQAAGRDVHLVGNIGVPVLDFIEQAGPDTIFVQEMSSYQLMDLCSSPPIAVVTSFFPDHLDYHGSLEDYLEAKKNICRFQTATDVVFYAADTEVTQEIATAGQGQQHPYTEADAPVTIDQTKLQGTHNLRNIAGAWKVAEHLGVKQDTATAAIQSFVGLPHRLQHIGTIDGIDWVDDAISTTPESTIAALEALGDNVQTLICGGQDRGYDFTDLGATIDTSTIETVVLFPDSGNKIRNSISNDSINCIAASDMSQAVQIAREATDTGRTCLLSTASPSYNMFKNFEQKGDEFQKCARGLLT